MACNNNTQYLLLYVLTILLTSVVVCSSDESEAKTLVKFKKSLSNSTALNDWDESISLCSSGNRANWTGVLCLDGKFIGLRLEGMGLSGRIDVDTLADLPTLRTISFMNNNFEGPMPNINKLGGLRGFYISNNKFSGEIPNDAFSGTRSLRKVYLSDNEFKGKIPKSLGNLPKLVEVHLEGNYFEGPIPVGLSNHNSSSFTGNLNLCGKPLNSCPPSKKRNAALIIIIIVVIVAVLLAATIAAYYFYNKSSKRTNIRSNNAKLIEKDSPTKSKAEETHQIDTNYRHDNHYNKKGGSEKSSDKLHFVRDDREKFDLQDLLRASAEVLGSGCFGSSYKAVLLLGGPALVVKRYRQMSNVGKVEFYEYMRKLGSLSHPNVLPLVAFYYKKEENLLISDFAHNGSLASHLHGKQSPSQPGLDWTTRLKVIKGVAKGLGYLNKELHNITQLPHGHLKSTNVLLDRNYQPILADYGLLPIVNKQDAQQLMAAYKSPDFTQNNLITIKTDVWCLGILILEILTGKFPANYLTQVKGENVDLASWVNSVVREEWTGEVFDKEMKGRERGEGEMLKLLKIGMFCCESDVDKRWDLEHALSKIQELKEREIDDENESTEDDYSYASAEAADHRPFYSSSSSVPTMSVEEEFSFSATK